MFPSLKQGDEVLINPYAYKHYPPTVGDIVVTRHPKDQNLIIKRITRILPNGYCFLEGDNPLASTDSRTFGYFPPQLILGRVTSQLPDK